jgi:hypothetical protein
MRSLLSCSAVGCVTGDLATSLENYYHRNGSWVDAQSVIDVNPRGMGV